ncbi:hypothetical protein P7C70_g3685, partial [Phenoliferia sp. Uapishka_3]
MSVDSFNIPILLAGSSLLQGLAQEGVIKGSYGIGGKQQFDSPCLLILAVEIGLVLSIATYHLTIYSEPRPPTSWSIKSEKSLWPFVVASIYNLASPIFFFYSLRHLSFTTVSLAPFAFTALSLLVEGIAKDFVPSKPRILAASFILIGLVLYIISSSDLSLPIQSDRFYTFVGSGFLLLHVVFDHLSRNQRERIRPKLDEPPYDMSTAVFPHLLTAVLAIVGVVLDYFNGRLFPSIHLILSDQILQIGFMTFTLATAGHRLTLDANRALGFGWRIYGRFGDMGFQEWSGIGWVASGVWFALKAPTVEDGSDSDPRRYEFVMTEARRASDEEDTYFESITTEETESPAGNRFTKYLLPILLPLVLAPLLATLRSASQLFPTTTEDIQMFYNETNITVEGSEWEKEFVAAIWPDCDAFPSPRRWPGTRRTALASDPRSGNTFVRESVERSTSWQTGTVNYCDTALSGTLKGECDKEANFLIKTHYPDALKFAIDDPATSIYITKWSFDQVVHLIRNPVDSLYSGWQLAHVSKLPGGVLDHSGRLNIPALGATAQQRADVIHQATIWNNHEKFWRGVNLPSHLVRYEDLLVHRLPTLMSLLVFLLPDEELPSADQVACALELDKSREAYVSRKAPPFASWDLWAPGFRTEIIKTLKVPWCRNGFQYLLREWKGTDTGVDDLCD